MARKVAKNKMPTATHSAVGVSRSSTDTTKVNSEAKTMADGYASEAESALATLPRNEWTDALRGLAHYAIDRES